MKKLFAVLICIVFLLTSCAKADLVAYELHPIAFSSELSNQKQVDIPWRILRADAPTGDPEETVTITFDGKTYSGKYAYASQNRFNTYRSLFYEFSGGIFSVNETTGQVDYIKSTMLSTGGKTEAECEAEVIRIASQFINTEDYKLTIESDETSQVFSFVRYIAGIETSARLCVTMKTYGGLYKLYSVELQMVDEVEAYIHEHGLSKTETQAKRLSSNAAHSLVKERIKENYPNNEGYTIQDGVLTVSGDGQLGMLYEVSVAWNDQDGEYTMEGSYGIRVVVTTR